MAALLGLALVAAGCGSDDGGSSAAGGDGTTTTAAAPGGSTTTTEGRADVGTGPGTPAPQPLAERATVRVSLPGRIEFVAALMLADHFGEFDAENLDVEFQILPGADATVLLAQGQIDVVPTGYSAAAFNLISTGADVRFVPHEVERQPEGEGFYMRREFLGADGEPDFDRLRGARVVAGVGGGGWGNPGSYSLYQLLVENGLDPITETEAQTVLTSQDVILALENGQTDVGYVATPAWQAMVDNPCCVQVTSIRPKLATYVVNSVFLQEDREVARAFFRAIMRTERTYLQGDFKDDPEVLEALAAEMEQPAEDIAAIPSVVFDPDMAFNAEGVEFFQEQYRAAGLLTYDTNIPVADLTEPSIIEEILAGE